ncbi:MAG: discoidin domain-containing protein, partial [Candidatus Binatia bacterium]
ASFVLGGTGTALLIADLGASVPAAILGGAVFAFGPLRLAQLGHVHALSTHWMPFTLLFLQRSLRTGALRPTIAFAASLLLVALSSVYCLYYFGVAVGLFVVFHAVWRCPAGSRAYRRVLGAGGAVLLAVLPTLLPYADVRERFAMARDPQQTIDFSAVGLQYLGAISSPGGSLARNAIDGRLLTPLCGLGLIALATAGMWRGARRDRGGRRIAALYLSLAVAMILVSLGPVMRMRRHPAQGMSGPHALLSAVVPGFDSLRVPQRAAAGALLALGVLAGLGADVLVQRRRGLVIRSAGGLLATGIALLECWRPGLQVLPAPSGDEVPAVYRWLGRQPGDFAVVELPLEIGLQESVYAMMSAYHWKRLVNGYSTVFPGRDYLKRTLAGFPDAASLRLLHGLRVHFVILHTSLLPPGDVESCAQTVAQAPSYLALRYEDGDACAFDVLGAPPLPERPPERLVPLAGAHLTSSSGDDPAPATDGDRSTHWIQSVGPAAQEWLQIDLPEARPLTRLVIHLGRHFGEHLRAYAVAASADGVDWTVIAHQPVAAAPFDAFLTDPDDVTIEILLPGTPIRSLRLVRPPALGPPVILYLDWDRWGVHELELYERASAPPEPVDARPAAP